LAYPDPDPNGLRGVPVQRASDVVHCVARDVDEIHRRREGGKTVVAIAQAIGASVSGVRRAIKRNGIQRPAPSVR
jgi:hypothetical protein